MVLPAVAIAFGTLALLGLMIGWVGASQAYSVSPTAMTLFRDHLAAVSIMVVVAAAAGLLVGRSLRSNRELLVAAGVVLLTDVAAALLVTAAISEMARHPQILRAVYAESAGGMQLLAIAAGLILGRLSRRASREWRVSR